MSGSSGQDRPVYTLELLAREVGGEAEGDPSLEIRGVAGIREAGPGEITFVANSRYVQYIERTGASALILAPGVANGTLPVLRAADPYVAYLKILRLFASSDRDHEPGWHQSAVVEEGAEIAEDCHLGAQVYVGRDTRIGAGGVLMPGVVVLEDCEIGPGCRLFPGVVIREGARLGRNVTVHSGSVIGADGFGYAWDGSSHQKIPQIGSVEIGDDVEIGANVTIDRATTGWTRIGSGSRIDNLVQIAHNVAIGENSIIVAQAGISGSTEIGSGVTIAGQAGVTGHIRIGDGVVVAAQAGVTKSVPEGICVSGYPARPHDEALRTQGALNKLPALLRRVAELERKLRDLEDEKAGEEGSD